MSLLMENAASVGTSPPRAGQKDKIVREEGFRRDPEEMEK
jgi:hypothetical protein